MTTARDIIESALRKIHVLGTGSPLEAEEANQALSTLNDFLAVISEEGAYTYQEVKETFNLTSGQASYTIASGGDFDTTAPKEIKACFITLGDTDYILDQYDEAEYAGITNKDDEGLTNGVFYYDYNYPTANIYFYPVPSGAETVTLYTRKPLTEFTDLDTVFAFPANYKAMLIHNLAMWIAPEYEREASATIQKLAKRTKNVVLARNKRNNKPVSSLAEVPQTTRTRKSYGNVILGGAV